LIPPTRALAEDLVKRYTPWFGRAPIKTEVDEELAKKADELIEEMHTPEWLYENDRRTPDTSIKIREGVYVVRNAYKAPGGLIQVTAIQRDGYLSEVHLSGDFFFYPSQDLRRLEEALCGIKAEKERVFEAVSAFYTRQEIESPGVLPEDWSRALFPVN
jgi:hypothetical protein